MITFPTLLAAYAIAALLIALLASRRGRSASGWLAIALFATPVLAAFVLWLLRDLEHERTRTQEFLTQAKQRRHRRDPDDTFSRTREQQEHDIQIKVITARLERQRLAEQPPVTRRQLRSRENRTPATAIMQM
ncbi:MAG TPA: hypothetical protein VHX44_07350 [Planctomycetota bacterium]|jgi:uncharacterized membrane protein YeiB|nr:hypothetical protein [Planctomycetota bacterium]